LPLRHNRHSLAVGSNPIFAVLPKMDNQSAFWSLHPYVYGKTFPAIPFSSTMATVATEQKNGNGTTERHNGMAEWQRNGGNKAQVCSNLSASCPRRSDEIAGNRDQIALRLNTVENGCGS